MNATGHTGRLRRLSLSVAVGATAALAITGASVAVRDRLKSVPSQPPRNTVSTRPVAPPPIALPLVLQANPPVPSIGEPATTTTTPTTTKPKTTSPARGGSATGKPAGTKRARTR